MTATAGVVLRAVREPGEADAVREVLFESLERDQGYGYRPEWHWDMDHVLEVYVDNPRNKPDDVLDAVAARGGVVGCCLYPLVVGGAQATLDGFCDMARRLADQIGPDHVALGSDCTRNWDDGFVEWLRSGRWRPPGDVAATWPAWPNWFTGPEDFPRLTDGLVAVGFDDQEVQGILGENWLRLFDEVFTGPGGPARDDERHDGGAR